MKNTIQLNIGLTTQSGTENTVADTLSAVRTAGLHVTASRLVQGEWEGKPESTLALECASALPLCHAECRMAIQAIIARLAGTLDQTCIALRWPEGHGELLPNVGKFDAAFFHAPFPDLTRQPDAIVIAWL